MNTETTDVVQNLQEMLKNLRSKRDFLDNAISSIESCIVGMDEKAEKEEKVAKQKKRYKRKVKKADAAFVSATDAVLRSMKLSPLDSDAIYIATKALKPEFTKPYFKTVMSRLYIAGKVKRISQGVYALASNDSAQPAAA